MSEVLIDRTERRTVFTLDRDAKRNSLSVDLVEELLDAVEEAVVR